MKILLLCWRDTHHPQGGGSERYLERVASYLAAQGHQVIFRTAAYTDAPHRSQRDGVRFYRAGGKFTVYPRAWLAMLAGRMGCGALQNVDVVVDTQNGIPFFAHLFLHKPTVILTHHCHREQWPVAGPFLARLGWFLESRVSPWLHRSCRYVTVSQPSAQELVDLGVDPQRINIIRNGVDPIPAHVPTLAKDAKIHLVTLSRLVPHKQIEHAIKVVKELREKTGLPLVLDIIGSGWWEDELRRVAANDEAIVFHGHVSEAHKHALLHRASIQLLPSRKEGWGLAVIEAAQHAVPTIGYRSSGGLCDSIRDRESGLLAKDYKEFVALIATLLQQPQRAAQLGKEALALSRGYSWEKTGEEFSELLSALHQQGE